MVGDDAEPDVVGMRTGGVCTSGQFRGEVDDRLAQVGLVHVVDALQDAGHALDAHAGVDVLLGQRAQDLVVVLAAPGTADVLHEDEIPDLDVAVLVGLRPALDAVLGSAVVEDLRARPAGTRDAHRPVVVLHAPSLDALGRHADLVAPDGLGLVVVEIDRRPQLLRVDTETAVVDAVGQQRPGEGDGLALEVVAEGEVARHLEEGVVAGGDADLVDVEGADALLHAGRPRVRGRLLTQEERLERDHAGIDEQQIGVVEEQRSARHLGVPGFDEVVQKALPDVMRLHCGFRPSRWWSQPFG